MGIHLADQTMAFLHAVLLGMALGLLYDVFRITRIALPTPSKIIFGEDVCYFLLCAVFTFLLMMTVLDGNIRVFLLIGEFIGAVLYFHTVGRLVMGVSRTIIAVIKAILRFIMRFFLQPLWRLAYWLVSLLLRPVYFLGRLLKKTGQRLRFRLKIGRIVLYNHCKDYLSDRVGRYRKNAGDKSADEKEENP